MANNNLKWVVGYTFQASKFEKEARRIVATFDTKVLAEDFIQLVIPKDNQGRFFIEHIDN